jgi:hypothetical protein
VTAGDARVLCCSQANEGALSAEVAAADDALSEAEASEEALGELFASVERIVEVRQRTPVVTAWRIEGGSTSLNERRVAAS